MRRTLKFSAPLAALLGIGFAVPANAQAQEFQSNVEKARTTLASIATLIDKIEARKKEASAAAPAAVASEPVRSASGTRTYTVLLSGAACNGCAGALKKALESAGARVVTAPVKGAGQRNVTIAVIEVDSAGLAKLKAAVSGADTPHKSTSAPGLVVCAEGSIDGATPQAVRQAIQSGKLKRVEL